MRSLTRLLTAAIIFLAWSLPASAQSGGFVYALQDVNGGTNQIYGFSVNPTTGALTALAGFPVAAGTGGSSLPSEQLHYDTTNSRLFAFNQGSHNVSAFTVNRLTGALTALPFSPIAVQTLGFGCLKTTPDGSVLAVASMSGMDSVIANMLPDQGNGVFTIYAYADDADGHSTLLGTRTFTCTNASATDPFGAIDTPGQGELVSGVVNNFGWVLGPGARRADPPGGGAVTAFIDGAPVGTPSGWVNRDDLSALFPEAQYSGISRALGVYTFNSATLADGVHTIAWVVTDNQGAASGIGSRYFSVLNGTTSGVSGAAIAAPAGRLEMARVGPDPWASYRQMPADSSGTVTVEAREMERMELHLGAVSRGYLESSLGPVPLPVGSQLDVERGLFLWQPGPGFVGTYDFVFEDARGSRRVRVILKPSR